MILPRHRDLKIADFAPPRFPRLLAKPSDEYNVYKRPLVDEFIATCASWFDLAVWTAASSSYANEIIEFIFPKSVELKFIFTGERCTRRYDYDLMEAYYIKPLKKVKGRGFSLEKVLIIDDTPETFERNYGNGIQVKRYLGEREDNELILLLKYLKEIATVENVRTIDKRGWRDRISSTTSND